MPGDNVEITVELIAPIAMEEGLRFAIREGGRTVGAGVVAKIMAKSSLKGRIEGSGGSDCFINLLASQICIKSPNVGQ